MEPLSSFSFQSVHHDWCTRKKQGCGMSYPVRGMAYIKEPLLLIKNSNPYSGGSGFPLSLPEWSFTIYFRRRIYVNKNVLRASLNKTLLPSFLLKKNNNNKKVVIIIKKHSAPFPSHRKSPNVRPFYSF